MLITLKIWFWIFVDHSVWPTGGSKLSILRQQRWASRLAKRREKESLVEQKESLTNWRELVIFYRMITKRLLTRMVMW